MINFFVFLFFVFSINSSQAHNGSSHDSKNVEKNNSIKDILRIGEENIRITIYHEVLEDFGVRFITIGAFWVFMQTFCQIEKF